MWLIYKNIFRGFHPEFQVRKHPKRQLPLMSPDRRGQTLNRLLFLPADKVAVLQDLVLLDVSAVVPFKCSGVGLKKTFLFPRTFCIFLTLYFYRCIMCTAGLKRTFLAFLVLQRSTFFVDSPRWSRVAYPASLISSRSNANHRSLH